MRWIFRVLPIALVLGLSLAIWRSGSLPDARTLTRTIVVRTSAAEAYERLARIRGWEGWYIPPGQGEFEGPDMGAGGTLAMTSEEDGARRRLQLVATSSVPPIEVVYTFPDVDQLPYEIEGRFRLEALDAGRTRVVSSQALRSRAPDEDWMARTGERWFLFLLADRFVGSILDRELQNLKAALEGGTLPAAQ